jgi:PHP family Zn ribbon phosphoesterase
MLRWVTSDLHVHTCLSPCADLTMSPRKITAQALQRQLDLIAITDHNSAENVPAVVGASEGTALTVLPGLEVCTAEEVHVLALFDTLTAALVLQSLVYSHLQGQNDPDAFGLQVVANKDDEVEGFQERLLIGATGLTLERLVGAIHELSGLAVAAHVDRGSFSVISQLGFIPPAVKFDALEVSANTGDAEAKERFGQYRGMPMMRSSDAHFLSHLGRAVTRFLIAEPTVRELRLALVGEEGRRAVMKLVENDLASA